MDSITPVLFPMLSKAIERFSFTAALPHRRTTSSSNQGFTMIEAIIGIFLIGILSSIMAMVLNTSFKIVAGVQNRKTMLMDGSISVNKFSREYDQVIDENSLQYADEKKIRFNIGQGVTLEYELDNDKLYRKIVGQGEKQVLTQSVVVASSVFKYFGSNNNQLANVPLSAVDRKNVWTVELTLIIINNDQTIAFLANVFPENLKIIPPASAGTIGLGAPPPPPPGF